MLQNSQSFVFEIFRQFELENAAGACSQEKLECRYDDENVFELVRINYINYYKCDSLEFSIQLYQNQSRQITILKVQET